jgi:predicted HTH domain antitoxin
MASVQTVSVPQEILDLLESRDVPADERVRRALAVHLFVTGEVSVGRAAELAGMRYEDFLALLKSLALPTFVYDEASVVADKSTADALPRRPTAH